MNQKKITYILGAGASCKSQPLVSNMKIRMESLMDLLNPESEIHQKLINPKFKNRTSALYRKYTNIVQETLQHYTPDTYAKKLFLTKETEKLETLKEFLNLYFLFEQDISQEVYDTFASISEILTVDNVTKDYSDLVKNSTHVLELDDKIQAKFNAFDEIKIPKDYRYDVFFATLLVENNGILELPTNINVISWNYDNQFELAYKEYCPKLSYKEILNYLKIYPCPDYVGENKIDKIIRLNGFANNYIKRRILIEHNNETKEAALNFDNVIDTEINFYTLLKMLVDNDLDDYPNNINFAWEQNPMQKNAINQSYNLIINTDILVIIGYSFPNFNREVDKKIFSSINGMKDIKIIIQVPEIEEFEKIKQRILIINENIDKNDISQNSDRDQFYIPL